MNRCMQLFGRALNSGPCARFKEWRNENVRCYERCFKIFSVILFAWSIIMLATGMAFANLSWFDQDHEPIKKVQNGFKAFVVIFSLLGMLIAIHGFCIARKRTCHTACVALFGFVVFFLGLIPLFSELTAFRMISDIDNSDIDYYCDLSKVELQDESKFIRSLFTFAHRFDELSEQHINKHMCTDLCPCNDGEPGIKPTRGSFFHFFVGNDYSLSGESKYKLKKYEKALKAAGRSFKAKSSSGDDKNQEQNDSPMVFTRNTNTGFWKFKDCLEAKSTSEEFKYTFGREQDPDTYNDNTEVLYHPSELKAYQMLEDEFYCSGMCRKGLFFFDKNITLGPPTNTCLKQFHEYVQERSGAFSLAIMMSGLCTVTLFVMHAGMYCRPPTKDEENYDQQIEMGEQQPADRANVYEERDKEFA